MHSPLLSRRAESTSGRLSLRMIAVLLVVGCAVVVSAMFSSPWQPAASVAAGAPVRRGPLRITVTSSGNLKAADTVRLTSGVEGRTTILTLAPEGTQVVKGEVVCELDATALVEKRIEQTIKAGNTEAALVKATQSRAIQESQNHSDVNAAGQAVEFARQDLQMFIEGERDLELEQSQQTIDLAKEEAQRARDRLAWSQQLNEKGFLTSSELEADRISEHRSAVTLLQSTRERDLLLRFKLPRRESELRSLLAEAELERERVELQARARLVDFDSDVRSAQASLELEREKLARLEDQIEKAKLRAPGDGYVVYAQRDNDDPPISEGAEVREREEILAIPSSDGMMAELKLHESVLKQVQVGQACTLRIDALPGLELEGRVEFVALLPDQNSRWSNPNLRLYRCEIEIVTVHPGLRPGMSCVVEIFIEELEDALYVPVQAVFRDGSSTASFVASAAGVERRDVRVGRYNDLWVQVLEGLSEGETVLMQAPPGFVATPVEDEDEAEADTDEREVQPAEERDDRADDQDDRGNRADEGAGARSDGRKRERSRDRASE